MHTLGLVCDESDLWRRIHGRMGGEASAARADLHVDINRRIAAATTGSTLDVTLTDASRPTDEVEQDVRAWIVGLATDTGHP